MIRLARPEDAAAMLAIYGPYVRETSLTFETEVPSESAFSQRIADYMSTWPWLVFGVGGRIAGYAYGSKYRDRAGYQWCVECSVYIDPEFQAKGIGRKLYEALFRILRAQGYYNVYAVINLPNETSVRLHEACGFRWFANYEQVGFKLGKWKTVGWWQLQLRDYQDNPTPPRKFSEMDTAEIGALLEPDH